MDRERAKELLPIIQAFAEGKKVELALFDDDGAISEWSDVLFPKWLDNHIYRIKPEPKYRPFEDAEECWEEMQKHQPFGWVKTDSGYEPIWHVNEGDDFNATFKDSTFADGTPYGIKEEE